MGQLQCSQAQLSSLLPLLLTDVREHQTASDSASQSKGAPRLLLAQPHRGRGSTQTTSGSASQTQREHPDHCRLSLTDAEAALRLFQAQPHRHRGSTQTTAGSASQMQRKHPDHGRLSLTDTEGAPGPRQAQPHRCRGSTRTASGSVSAFIAPAAPSRHQGLRPGFSPRPSFGIFGASPLFIRGILL